MDTSLSKSGTYNAVTFTKKYHMIALNRIIRGFMSGAAKGHFGQWAEDVLVRKLFPKSKKTGIYLDLGAYHPFIHSNTAFFWMKGWSGINVDANPNSIELFNKVRPRDTNVWAALVPQKDIREGAHQIALHLSDQSDTQSKISATGTVNSELGLDRGFSKSINVPATCINDLLNTQKVHRIDYLNIDIEGIDVDVLKEMDFARISPHVVTIEDYSSHLKELVNSDISIHMEHAGYALVGRAGPTSIFVHE
jgi:FkbM family methyltransferase